MTAGTYAGGFVVFAGILGASAAAAWILVQRRLPALDAVERVVAFGLLATTTLLLAHVIPGVLGLLSRGSVLFVAAAELLGALLVPAVAATTADRARDTRPSDGTVSLGLVLAGLLATTACVALYVAQNDTVAIDEIDMLTFHLPGVANWMDTGSLWSINQFVPDLAHGDYPNNGDIVLLSAVLPWHTDAFVHFTQLPYVAFTGLGVLAIGRELEAPRTTAALFALFAVSIPVLLSHAVTDAYPDTVLYATFVAGVLFLMRHARTAARSDLVLAGVGLGVAFGTKWYGVSGVAAVLVVWAGAMIVRRTRWRRLLREGATLAGLVAVLGGFWLLRNWIKSGNPLFPVRVAPLGITIFDAPPDRIRMLVGFSIADYATKLGAWRDFILPAFGSGIGLGSVLLLLATLVAPVLAWGDRRRGLAPDGRVIAGGVAIVLLAGIYVVTPYTAQGLAGRPDGVGANTRYLVPALLLAAPLAAWCAGRLRRGRVLIEAVALIAILDALTRTFHLSRPKLVLTAVALALLSGAGWAVAQRWSRVPNRARLAVATASAFVLLLAVGGYGRHQQNAYAVASRFASEPVIARLTAPAPHPTRVGIAGLWDTRGLSPVLAAFGARLDNHVAFAGQFRRGMLRSLADRSAFLRRVRRGRFDTMVVGRGAPPRPQAPEETFLRSAGWRLEARSNRLALYRRP